MRGPAARRHESRSCDPGGGGKWTGRQAGASRRRAHRATGDAWRGQREARGGLSRTQPCRRARRGSGGEVRVRGACRLPGFVVVRFEPRCRRRRVFVLACAVRSRAPCGCVRARSRTVTAATRPRPAPPPPLYHVGLPHPRAAEVRVVLLLVSTGGCGGTVLVLLVLDALHGLTYGRRSRAHYTSARLHVHTVRQGTEEDLWTCACVIVFEEADHSGAERRRSFLSIHPSRCRTLDL